MDAESPALSALPFYGVELKTQPSKCRKPCRQKTQDKFKHTAVQPSVGAAPEVPSGFKISDIIQLQQEDPTLSVFLQRARERKLEMDFDGRMEEYFQKSGVLYRQHGQVKQLVVPQAARDVVPTLGHLIPWTGHLEKHKTTACIKHHFFTGLV